MPVYSRLTTLNSSREWDEATGEPMQKMLNALVVARAKFATDQRAGAFSALWAVHEYLGEMGLPPNLTAPLFSLALALDELEATGGTPPMFVPKRPSHRPKISKAELLYRGAMASAMTAYMRNGVSREQAATKVCRLMARLGADHPDWQQLARWRNRAMAGGRDDVDTAVYRGFVRSLTAAQLPPAEAAKTSIRAALEVLGSVKRARALRSGNPKKPAS